MPGSSEFSADRLKVALELARAGLWERDLRTNRVVRSPIIDEMFGFRPGEVGDDATPFLSCIDPDDQPWYRGCDRLHEKLNALGVIHTANLQTRAGGHSWDYFDRMADPALRFLAAGLEHESRRLL